MKAVARAYISLTPSTQLNFLYFKIKFLLINQKSRTQKFKLYIELRAKLLDYFLRIDKSNINQIKEFLELKPPSPVRREK